MGEGGVVFLVYLSSSFSLSFVLRSCTGLHNNGTQKVCRILLDVLWSVPLPRFGCMYFLAFACREVTEYR